MLKKLKNDFNNLVKEIANLEELIKEKEIKTQKNEELKKASEGTKQELDKNLMI